MSNVTVRRKGDGPWPSCVSSGPFTITFDGDGPWTLTESEWSALCGTAARDSFEIEQPNAPAKTGKGK